MPKLLFLVTEDWYFCSHRLPVARAARDAGFAVAVACRVAAHGDAIRSEGFAVHDLAWRRRGDGALAVLRSLAAIIRLLRAERPDLVHLVALKPVAFGAVAARLAFPFGGAPRRIAAVMGLGGELGAGGGRPPWQRRALQQVLRLALRGADVVVQNPDDGDALMRLGLAPDRIAMIRGSGVDTARFVPLPEPEGPEIAVALVARMLKSKGVPAAAAALRRLRDEGRPIRLILAGPPDPSNRDTLSADELAALGAEPGIDWLGRVDDVRTVWRQAHIAVFPSTYGEGLPKALLEAAACGRPIVAADMPGTREIVRPGETGLLVPPGDAAALAAAIAALADDPAQRQALGRGGRTLVEREFAEPLVAAATLALYRSLSSERKVVG